ncbi:hypothetical protein [Amycolatopsis sp. FDAARGOS 1241]|uniref:hypothetical protein n=1 Tax=Amycolatopsis sp. FDAARGOS 1241 TaxID=2778070 RepID=UPI0019524905|nr:hypothetical protein [Amycolatopsis sp. FDAARGOS 1241]QRP47127.1 hypothetical protein I6J71_03635 [Amycolatopsis sp. FDAARGOS 1241]
MGHKGVRDGGPARDPKFRPTDVIGWPVRRAVIELEHQGYTVDVQPQTGHDRAPIRLSRRVRLVARDGVITGVIAG